MRLMSASERRMCFFLPSCCTVIDSLSSCASRVFMPLAPLGRPPGLPDCPFLNLLASGPPTGFFGAVISFLPCDPRLLHRTSRSSRREQRYRRWRPASDERSDRRRVGLVKDTGFAARSLCCDNGGAASAKAIENDTPTMRAIKDRIDEHRAGLYRGMNVEGFVAIMAGIGAGIMPRVGAVAALFAEIEVVDVGRRAVLEDIYQFVLGTVK